MCRSVHTPSHVCNPIECALTCTDVLQMIHAHIHAVGKFSNFDTMCKTFTLQNFGFTSNIFSILIPFLNSQVL